MRIVGGRDYYDSAGMGIDTSIVFPRIPVWLKDQPFPTGGWSSARSRDLVARRLTVCVGGRAFYGVFAAHNCYCDPHLFIWSSEEVDKLPEELLNSRSWRTRQTVRKEMEEWLSRPETGYESWLAENGVVVGHTPLDFDYNYSGFLANGDDLKDCQFYKCLSPPEVHMECARWVGGVLPQSKPIETLSDRSKIVKSGFDLKTSFRKGKTK